MFPSNLSVFKYSNAQDPRSHKCVAFPDHATHDSLCSDSLHLSGASSSGLEEQSSTQGNGTQPARRAVSEETEKTVCWVKPLLGKLEELDSDS